jgi:hypothetical protein
MCLQKGSFEARACVTFLFTPSLPGSSLADEGKSAVDWLLSMATSSAAVALERERETLVEALEQLDLEADPEAFDHAQAWSERSLISVFFVFLGPNVSFLGAMKSIDVVNMRVSCVQPSETHARVC